MNIKFFLLLSSLTLIIPSIFAMEQTKPVISSAKLINTLNFILQLGPSLALLSHSKPEAKIPWKTDTITDKQVNTTLLYTALLKSIEISSFPSKHNQFFEFLIPLETVTRIKDYYKNYYKNKPPKQDQFENNITDNPKQEPIHENRQVANCLNSSSSWQTKAYYGLGGIGLFATGWLGKTWWDSRK